MSEARVAGMVRDALSVVGAVAVVGGTVWAVRRALRASAKAKTTAEATPAPAPAPTPATSSASTSTPAPPAAAAGGAGGGGAAGGGGGGGGGGRPVRVYIDGCFDMMHYGHSNALRQASKQGDQLVVGIVNDEEIMKYKGSAPVMPYSERLIALRACKWVHEVVENAPYDLSKEWVDHLVAHHSIDYIVHGDDPCITPDGKDAYAYAKEIGRFRLIKRTEGVSTTDIVGRMLLMTKEHHVRSADLDRSRMRTRSGSLGSVEDIRAAAAAEEEEKASAKFLPTSRRIAQFAEGRAPKPGDRVVYIAGSFDLFHPGHIEALQRAREHGDFLLVGIHDDEVVNRVRGRGFPILNLYERSLSVLACRYADEVIIGAPWAITKDMISTMGISLVVEGSVCDLNNADDQERARAALEDAVKVPRELGMLRVFDSPSKMTAKTIIDRIVEQRAAFEKRFESKAKKEADYYKTKEETREYIEEA